MQMICGLDYEHYQRSLWLCKQTVEFKDLLTNSDSISLSISLSK